MNRAKLFKAEFILAEMRIGQDAVLLNFAMVLYFIQILFL